MDLENLLPSDFIKIDEIEYVFIIKKMICILICKLIS